MPVEYNLVILPGGKLFKYFWNIKSDIPRMFPNVKCLLEGYKTVEIYFDAEK